MKEKFFLSKIRFNSEKKVYRKKPIKASWKLRFKMKKIYINRRSYEISI